MALCEGCQRDIDVLDRAPAITRGALTVSRQPPAATWAGRDLHLTATQAAILYSLARTGEASHVQLDVVSSVGAAKIHIMRLRQSLASIGVRGVIQAVHGWGYRLNPDHFREVADAN